VRVDQEDRAQHWESAYTARGVEGVSWYEPSPAQSLKLVEALDVMRDARVIDVGGGASRLVDELAGGGFTDLTVLDISASALEKVRERLHDPRIRLLRADLLEWEPPREYDLWHDRAVFHFLVDDADRQRYLATLRRAVARGGAVVIATFAPDGPEVCSGLPVRRYSAEELVALLGDDFELQRDFREQHTTPHGLRQPFTWIAGRIRA
jgi:trans-aconitate methyltransferase